MAITIEQYLRTLGYTPCRDETHAHLDEWEGWFGGYVKSFHNYSVYNGVKFVGKRRRSLNMAKTVCEDWASLLLNEKVKIYTGSEFDKTLEAVFAANNFDVCGNRLIELAFALGTGAFVEYLNEAGEVTIDFVRAGMIFPLNWENGYINECAFGSARTIGDKQAYYIQIHRLEHGLYVLENHLIDAESGKELDLSGIAPQVATGSAEPLFQMITPNIINNIDLDSPLGVSVYANAISQLEACDIVYDSYVNEFELGKKRIFIDVSLAQRQLSSDGTITPTFDPNDVVFYALPRFGRDEAGGKGIEEINPSIRAAEHELGIEKALDLLSFKCGLGGGRYRFKNGGVKTATEVISDKSELYQSLKKHEIVLGAALRGLVRAIAYLSGVDIGDIHIDFDDSIIEDAASERETDRTDVAIGAMGLLEYRMKWYGESEAEAAKMLPQSADVVAE